MANVATGCNHIKRGYDDSDAFASYPPDWEPTLKVCKMPSKKDGRCMLDTSTEDDAGFDSDTYSRVVKRALKTKPRDVPREHDAREEQAREKTTHNSQESKQRAEAFKTYLQNAKSKQRAEAFTTYLQNR